jgi:threonine dehydrogenase-like Zn-dependent dehydrogenase
MTIAGNTVHDIGYSNDIAGGFAHYTPLAERLLLEVPNGLPAAHAALTEPIAVGWHAVQKARLSPDDVPLVIGCGPVGLAVIASLKISGVHPIIAADFSRKRRALAAAMGGDILVDPGEMSPYMSWHQAATPGSAGGLREPRGARLSGYTGRPLPVV